MTELLRANPMLAYAITLSWAGLWIIAGTVRLLSHPRQIESFQTGGSGAAKRRLLIASAYILLSPTFVPVVTPELFPWSLLVVAVMVFTAGALIWAASRLQPRAGHH
jgi:hypothetical protein